MEICIHLNLNESNQGGQRDVCVTVLMPSSFDKTAWRLSWSLYCVCVGGIMLCGGMCMCCMYFRWEVFQKGERAFDMKQHIKAKKKKKQLKQKLQFFFSSKKWSWISDPDCSFIPSFIIHQHWISHLYVSHLTIFACL